MQYLKHILTMCLVTVLLTPPSLSVAASKTVILATTTSTQDSGLLDQLIPHFEKESGFVVKTIAVGSGQAMKMGEKGEADVLLVHSPDAENKFMAAGFGSSRRLVMHNDFVMVGPQTDPAGIAGAKILAEAMKRIAVSRIPFISRGDSSGTHAKEKALWKSAGISAEGQGWYQQTGLGMGQTLQVAAEKRGYTLTDRATWLAMNKRLTLKLLFEGDNSLLNIYHVIEVNPARWPKVNSSGANAFARFMISGKTQQAIGRFGTDKFGAPLFSPDAGRKPAELGL
jgi:tungstate transport system substrate-binding protein